MPYCHLEWETIRDSSKKSIFEHTDMYLFDTYGMLRMLPPSDKDGGGGNFSATLVLLCVIDGLAKWRYPNVNNTDGKRFKQLIRDELPWGPVGKDKWVDKGNAADQLYTEFRNPLVHELAKDTKAKSRPSGYLEPVIEKWNSIPKEYHDIEKIDALSEWDKDWPILTESTDNNGNTRYKLTVSALYWAVKNMANKMCSIE